MNFPIHTDNYGSYAFRFHENINEIAQIWSVGLDVQTSPLYNWNGSNRRDKGNLIFQYTISGSGKIVIDGQTHILNPGQSFLVGIPGNFNYYLPEDNSKWEFIYITLYGKEAERCWEYIRRHFGSIVRLHPESPPIQKLMNIHQMAADHKIGSSFKASSLAYDFIMALYEYSSKMNSIMDEWPKNIVSAVLFIQNHYTDQIGAEHMSEAANLSRYHFTRLFKKTTGMSPIQYLTRIRVAKSADLLLNSKLKVEHIAECVGYQDANYFNKVFQKVTGQTPSNFRKHKGVIQF